MPLLDRLEIIYGRARAELDPLIRVSKVFCMAPWMQLHAQTNGDVGPCCMANMDNGNAVSNLNMEPDLTKAWNSFAMRQLRRNMLIGRQSSICLNCYEYEKVGRFSERMQYNRDFKRHFHRVLSTRPDGSIPHSDIPLIDIRFSNRCNYKCRICSSEYSSLWHEEELRLNPDAKPYPKSLKVAADEVLFWQSFERLLPDVKRLHFAGGEPLVMDEHYRTIDHLVSIGRTDLNLSYNTNFSILNHKGHDLPAIWNRFAKVDIWASLDGMGAKGDYQRKGQNWERIEANIRELQQRCRTTVFGVNVTVSIFNVLHVPDFYRHLVESGLADADRVNLYFLQFPYEFSVTNLTPGLKQQVREQYADFMSSYVSKRNDTGHFANHMQAVINRMDSVQDELLQEFRTSIDRIDRLRGEDFRSVFPELSEMVS
jgi:MoaA/NifB/PqqE/SkfB family radical SAM enzyme